jgi:hypothetical protein
MMLCEIGFLSLGGGDGHYGLWLDDTFEKGISSHCLTFGNEPLSDEGEKFDIIGVELWTIGNSISGWYLGWWDFRACFGFQVWFVIYRACQVQKGSNRNKKAFMICIYIILHIF